MHYKNGREAKNGDKVVLLDYTNIVGILYDAQAGNDTCNGKLAIIQQNDACPNLSMCLHLDDVKAFLEGANVPDSSISITKLAEAAEQEAEDAKFDPKPL